MDSEQPNKNNITSDDDNLDHNLSNNKVDTQIEPQTKDNKVYISICSCTLYMNCSIM